MSFLLDPGQLAVQPENRFLCCLLQAGYLSPARFVVDAKAARMATLIKSGAPLFLQSDEAGLVQKLQVGGKGLRLYAYGKLKKGVDAKNCLALAKFKTTEVECPICNRVFESQVNEPCPCIHKAPCLMLRTICIESVHLYPRWNEDSKQPGTLSEYLSRQFKTAVDYIQVIDPL